MNSWHYLVFWFEFLHACLVLMCLLMASTQNDIVLIKMHHFEFFWATSESFKIIHIIFYYSLPILFLCHFLLWYFPIILIHTHKHTYYAKTVLRASDYDQLCHYHIYTIIIWSNFYSRKFFCSWYFCYLLSLN